MVKTRESASSCFCDNAFIWYLFSREIRGRHMRPSGILVTNPFSSQADIPKGAISCKAITRVYEHRKCGKSKREFLFCVDTPDRTYTMYAPTEHSMKIWMTCLTISPTAIELQRDQTYCKWNEKPVWQCSSDKAPNLFCSRKDPTFHEMVPLKTKS